MRSRPIIDEPSFEEAHLEFDTRLRRYATTQWGRKALTQPAKLNMRQDTAMSLKATNAWARIAYMKSALAAFDRYAQIHGVIDPAFFVTIAPSHLAFNFDQPLPAWERDRFEIATMFARAHSFGSFDNAYFGNVNTIERFGRSMLSLHSHLLVWGIEEEALKELRRIYNAKTRSARPPRPAFHFIPARLTEHIIYLCKAPIKENRYDQRSLEEIKIIAKTKNGRRSGPWERDLRQKDAARMCNLLTDITIPTWTICTGDGIQLAQEVREDTIKRLERDQAARLAGFRSLLSISPR